MRNKSSMGNLFPDMMRSRLAFAASNVPWALVISPLTLQTRFFAVDTAHAMLQVCCCCCKRAGHRVSVDDIESATRSRPQYFKDEKSYKKKESPLGEGAPHNGMAHLKLVSKFP